MATGARLSVQLNLTRGSRAFPLRSSVLPGQSLRCSRTQSLYGALARFYSDKSFPPFRVIKMPSLSPTMEAGNLGAWQKKVGDTINPGDVLVEIETDKAQMDFEIQEEGVLAKILKEQGVKDVPVGNPVAILTDEGQDVSAFESFTMEDAGGDIKPGEAKQESSELEPSKEAAAPALSEGGKAPAISTQESDSTGARLETSLDRQPSISPAAKRLALEKGVPVGQIKGTGRGGQITKEDVEKFTPSGLASGAAAAGPAYEDAPPSSMRKTIASRLTQSMQQSPHYFVNASVSVTKLLKLRAALNASSAGAYKLSVNDFLIKAIALAALKVPAVNSSWRGESGNVFIRTHSTVDVSVAVATASGLMTPIVKNAHAVGLEAISKSVKDMGKRARDGKLKPEEYQGGTITISNMGMNEAVERFTAVINPPQACIVAVGTVKKVAVPDPGAEDGETPGVLWDEQIVLTGSFDHKVVDGAVGGEFMREVKRIIEDPLKMLL